MKWSWRRRCLKRLGRCRKCRSRAYPGLLRLRRAALAGAVGVPRQKKRKKKEKLERASQETAQDLAAVLVTEMQKEMRRNFWRGLLKDIMFFAMGVATPYAINAVMAGS